MPGNAVHRNEAVIWDVVDGKTTLCHTDTAEFFTINRTGAAIWELCDGRTVDALVAELGSRYPAEHADRVCALVRDYVADLERHGLVSTGAADQTLVERALPAE